MLDALEAVARQRDLRVTRIDGRWPDVADRVPPCDVAVCSHVFYNVADLGAFALALSAHATKRVVVELHAVRLEELEREAHDPRAFYLIGEPAILPLPDGSVDEAVGEGVEPELRRVMKR